MKDCRKLYELQDIVCDILSTKKDPRYEQLLAYFDISEGVNPIIAKLPPSIQHKLRDRTLSHKQNYGVVFLSFAFFVDFISEMSRKFNDPGFKANMNSYILLQTAAIFFLSSLYLKQGIGSVYVMVGFICKGLSRDVKNASQVRITKLKILADCGIRTRDLPFTKRARYH